MGNTIKYSSVSKPFIITAVILLFIGSSIGSIWMMSIFGITPLPTWIQDTSELHKMLQIDGFLTLLIMGIGYMIIPRFRNIQLASSKLAYTSFFLILASLIIQSVQIADIGKNLLLWVMLLRISGISIFTLIILWTLRVRPKLLGLSDYFIFLCIVALMTVNLIDVSMYRYFFSSSLIRIQLWLLFPILMIFGIEYKTLPSFLGFIRPKKTLAVFSLFFISICMVAGLGHLITGDRILPLSMIFNTTLFASALTFAISTYAFGGFDNSEILRLIKGEKKARYSFIVIHIKISFLFLFIGILMAFISGIFHELFAFYDIAIHNIAIGFIGLSITLYLPLMLPPITGKVIRFTSLRKIPMLLIIISLSLRVIADFITAQPYYSNSSTLAIYEHISLARVLTYLFGLSGWLVVVAMIAFVIMIHKSMNEAALVPGGGNANSIP
jgi:hypothetical protein